MTATRITPATGWSGGVTTTDVGSTVHTEAGPGFTAPLAEFTAAVNALSVAVATRPPLPLLGGVLITRDVNGLRLSTFDYETSITVALDSEPGVPSAVLVSLAELRKVLKAATKGETARSTASWQVQFASAVNTGTRMEHRSEEYGYRDGARVTTREAGKIPVDFRNRVELL